jgi:hypothetical protein
MASRGKDRRDHHAILAKSPALARRPKYMGGIGSIANIGDYVRLVEDGNGASDQLQVDLSGGADYFVTVAMFDANAGVKILYNDDQNGTVHLPT